MRRLMPSILAVATLGLGVLSAGGAAHAVGEPLEPPDHEWSQEGVFGTFDKAQLRRGFQVYQEVCSACHAMKYFAFRNLKAIGFTEDEVKEIAAEYSVIDGPDEEGEMYERPARLSDRFPPPFPNENAARAANNGALPVDLSLIVKARENGLNYVYALLTGYGEEPPEDLSLTAMQQYNPYFSGRRIVMPPPLFDGFVEYEDGTEATVGQMAEDVVAFLHWMAEPKLEERKQVGLKVLIFLGVFSALMYAVTSRVKPKPK